MAPTAAESREQLSRILGSSAFKNTDRLSQLLAYLVEAVLSGSGEPLKEYRIALDAFGRPESFDPRTDSVVRVTARQLRLKLREYYETEGAADPIRIDLPKGSYVLEFAATDTPKQGRPWRWVAAAVVLAMGAAAYRTAIDRNRERT